MLDKLGSGGKNRPPAFLDRDCSVRLPLNQHAFRLDPLAEAPTLEAIQDMPTKPLLDSSDHFALTIFMISLFGQVVTWAFSHSWAETRLPWDTRSKFAHINGLLTSFESYSDACDGNFAKIIDRDFVVDGRLDEGAVGHFACAHVLYHMSQCLLHHPFLLRRHLKSTEIKVPATFLQSAMLRSQEHAIHLTAILHVLQSRGSKAFPTFFGYAAGLAGVIHRLHASSSMATDNWVAEANWNMCLNFLDQSPVRWESWRRIVSTTSNSNTAARPPIFFNDLTRRRAAF
jgi:hypothetical protein